MVDKYDLKKHANFHTIVKRIKYNEAEGYGKIEARKLSKGQKLMHSTKIVASGVGHLVNPS